MSLKKAQRISGMYVRTVEYCVYLTTASLEMTGAGDPHSETATTQYFCLGVFTDRSIFNLTLSRIQIPRGPEPQ